MVTDKVDNDKIIKLDDRLDLVKFGELETNAYLVKKSYLKDHQAEISQYNECVNKCMEPMVKAGEYLDFQLRIFQYELNN
mmetsp:Transcript_24545/g.28237  ORF Transcript_24545/g.28237 Transcript_24545/m.28237 type:complete len:80 (+) Transcript_24545:180-419(+)